MMCACRSPVKNTLERDQQKKLEPHDSSFLHFRIALSLALGFQTVGYQVVILERHLHGPGIMPF